MRGMEEVVMASFDSQTQRGKSVDPRKIKPWSAYFTMKKSKPKTTPGGIAMARVKLKTKGKG